MSKAKKLIVCLLGACLIAFSSISVFASTANVYNVPIAQPQINENSCYLEVVTANNWKFMFYCTVSGVGNNSSVAPRFYAKMHNGYLIIYTAYSTMTTNDNQYPVGVSGVYYDITWNSYGQLTTLNDTSIMQKGFFCGFSTGNSGAITKIHGYNCDVSAVSSKNSADFTFVYGTDVISNERLKDIYNAVNSLGGNISSSINSNADKNANKIQSNADKNASAIQSNNDKNTQSIIDNQNQLAEQEKNETQNSGNDSVSDVSGSVPDKSAGMLSALQSLSNAVSYTGTSAKWKFPQMYIPAISGVTDRINLNSEMEIDFTYWVNHIPQDIRTIISALATIGLIIFAFKELYGLISYVLTLKGGDNNE